MIELNNVSKQFTEGSSVHKVLDGLTLGISEGEIVILFGKSGSGKSTLLNIISGIDLPDTGNVKIRGEDITQMTEKDRTLIRRNHMGFVFQSFNLIPTLTVKENLLLPMELKNIANPGIKVRDMLEEVGLPGREDTYPDRLSGGEQQRVAIARAIIHDPEIILADEPTGNLDFDTGLRIVDLLDRVAKQKGKTMVMVTHSREVTGLADRVLTLREGRLAEITREAEFE